MNGDPAKGPHQGGEVSSAGAPLDEAVAAMILLHGRGGTAEGILTLVPPLNRPDYAYLAPQAAANSWYPYSFLAPLAQNEPGLSSGLRVLSDLVEELAAASVPPGRIVLLGFSQGGCLAVEFAARNARKYAGVIGLSGGLIGPDETPRDYRGSLAETPVFLGCSDVDPHIPLQRVYETDRVLTALDGDVTVRIYPGMGHTVNDDEIEFVRGFLSGATRDSPA